MGKVSMNSFRAFTVATFVQLVGVVLLGFGVGLMTTQKPPDAPAPPLYVGCVTTTPVPTPTATATASPTGTPTLAVTRENTPTAITYTPISVTPIGGFPPQCPAYPCWVKNELNQRLLYDSNVRQGASTQEAIVGYLYANAAGSQFIFVKRWFVVTASWSEVWGEIDYKNNPGWVALKYAGTCRADPCPKPGG
jgi:hypothetical protein